MLVSALLALLLAAPSAKDTYKRDVRFALTVLEKECGHFFKLKKISWAKVRKRILREVKGVRSHEEHWMLLWKIVVQLRDGHADVLTTDATKNLKWPGTGLEAGPRVSWVESGGKVWIGRAWGDAASAGVEAGMQVVKADGVPVAKWLEQLIGLRRGGPGAGR